MKKLKILIALTFGLMILAPIPPSNAVCQGIYKGQFIPYYELGEQVGVQCVMGGNVCNCYGHIYYY